MLIIDQLSANQICAKVRVHRADQKKYGLMGEDCSCRNATDSTYLFSLTDYFKILIAFNNFGGTKRQHRLLIITCFLLICLLDDVLTNSGENRC